VQGSAQDKNSFDQKILYQAAIVSDRPVTLENISQIRLKSRGQKYKNIFTQGLKIPITVHGMVLCMTGSVQFGSTEA
jgi:hypothetical protein